MATSEQNPLVSVIMPAYNARLYIGEAVRSVLDQDYPNLELIVIDDGSSDGTAEVAALFGDRVTVIRQANGGPAMARNKGIAAAKGEFIAFLDADDVWLPGKVSAQVEYLHAHPDVAVVYGVFSRWIARPDGAFDLPPAPMVGCSVSSVAVSHSGWIYPQLLLSNVVHIITAMVRRTVIEHSDWFDECLRTGEDYDLWLRLSRVTEMVQLNRTCAYYRIHPQSTTRIPRIFNNEIEVLSRSIMRFGSTGPDGTSVNQDALRRRMARMHFDHGYLHFWVGAKRIARDNFRKAIEYSPGNMRAWVYYLLSATSTLFNFMESKNYEKM